VPPDVTWPLPELAAGAVPGLKPLVPEELAEPEFALEEPEEVPGAAGRADADGPGWDVGVAVGECAVFPVTSAGPGRVRATAPAVMTLAAVMVVVTERILACPWSLALAARWTSSRFALFMLVTAGEVMPGW
jgi:hypothetical protein